MGFFESLNPLTWFGSSTPPKPGTPTVPLNGAPPPNPAPLTAGRRRRTHHKRLRRRRRGTRK